MDVSLTNQTSTSQRIIEYLVKAIEQVTSMTHVKAMEFASKTFNMPLGYDNPGFIVDTEIIDETYGFPIFKIRINVKVIVSFSAAERAYDDMLKITEKADLINNMIQIKAIQRAIQVNGLKRISETSTNSDSRIVRLLQYQGMAIQLAGEHKL